MKVQKQIKLWNIWAKNKVKKLDGHTHTNSYNLNKDHNICNLHFSNFFYKFFTRHVFHLPSSNNSELICVCMHIKMSSPQLKSNPGPCTYQLDVHRSLRYSETLTLLLRWFTTVFWDSVVCTAIACQTSVIIVHAKMTQVTRRRNENNFKTWKVLNHFGICSNSFKLRSSKC